MTLEEKIAMANQVRSRDRFGSVSPEEQAALPGTETELWIKTANGCKIHVFEERPDTLPPKAALLLNFHGGGFIKGRTDRDRRYCCTLMERLNCLVWDVDYCLAPEKAFPAAVHESYGIAEYAFDHAAELGVDPEKIILAGHSAGGNLVAAACIQMALPGGILTGIRFGAGQQGRAPVDKGIRFFGSSFPAIRHDLFQCGGTGLGLGQNGVEVFQLHPVALQRFQIQLRLGQDVLVQELPEVGDFVHAGAHLEPVSYTHLTLPTNSLV